MVLSGVIVVGSRPFIIYREHGLGREPRARLACCYSAE